MSTHFPACVLLILRTSRCQSVNCITLEQYQFQDTEGCRSEGQGLCHGQSHQRQPHSYLKHVCQTHSYAFTPLHLCLYLAVSLPLPGPKDTEIYVKLTLSGCSWWHFKTQRPQSGHFYSTLTWISLICWMCGDDRALFLTQTDKHLGLLTECQKHSRDTNITGPKISDSSFSNHYWLWTVAPKYNSDFMPLREPRH